MSKKKPEEQILQPQEAANNEALFEALGKSKKRRRRKTLLTVLIIVAVVVIAIAIAVNYFQKRVQERFDRMSGEVLSYTVQTGSISTVPVTVAHKVARPKKNTATRVVTANQVSSAPTSQPCCIRLRNPAAGKRNLWIRWSMQRTRQNWWIT